MSWVADPSARAEAYNRLWKSVCRAEQARSGVPVISDEEFARLLGKDKHSEACGAIVLLEANGRSDLADAVYTERSVPPPNGSAPDPHPG